ncbi:MAG: efflux transporter outer membrane subunit [Methylococcales bacterium]|nr:efflux transporter outer membrane subunit [Methylococcales bacterium]
MKHKTKKTLALVALPLVLSGCAIKGGWITTVGPDYQRPAPPTSPQWQAPQPTLAHQGKLADLNHWWEQFNDPILNRLLSAAQTESASIALAKARIEQAHASVVGADSLLLPRLDSGLNSSRSSFSFGEAPFLRTQHQLDVQSSWEIDLFGGLARQQEASLSQLEARKAEWHDARVAVAAELANAYLAYRYCETQLQLNQSDAQSRVASANLLAIAADAGFRTTADAALAKASAADGNNALLRRQAECEHAIKGLVALTGMEEPKLRLLLALFPQRAAKLPSPPPFRINAIPAKALLQRPDVAAAERDMAEASAKIGVEQAKRFPKLSLSGNITPVLQNINGAALTLAETWSYGPTLSLPIFDAGRRAANVDAAKADYIASISRFRATVRTAVKEVEDALVRLQSVNQRLPEVQAAADGYQTNFQATQKSYEIGLGNLLDNEIARRSMVTAKLAITELEQEKVSAWIALYRAVGGGWQADKQP